MSEPWEKLVDGPPETPTASCVSVESDRCEDEPGAPDTKPESPTASCVSMKSDQSEEKPVAPDTKEGNSGETFTQSPGLQTPHQTSTVPMDVSLQEALKTSLTERLEGQREDITEPRTTLLVTDGDSVGLDKQHEVWQLEKASKEMMTLLGTPIACADVFLPSPGSETPARRVLTKGVAGIGKTSSVYAFTLDWARCTANQDIDLLLPMSFRELNLVRDEEYSLLTLIQEFYPALKNLTAEQLAAWRVGFIFDGLDESRFSLKFNSDDIVADVSETTSVDLLLSNLIEGNLLPAALLWITTRPAAANQIPPGCVDKVTVIRGFTGDQKKEYIRKRLSDANLAHKIIAHMTKARTLHVMCHVPVFMRITVTVLEDMLRTDKTAPTPKTPTAMYCQVVQKIDRDVLLKLGRLAFEHLENGTIVFYQEDLEECGLDVKEASLYSSEVCPGIFKAESVLLENTVYSFVHQSMQEFLAAVFLFHCFTEGNLKVLKKFFGEKFKIVSPEGFLKRASRESLASRNGHLDFFIRFLHGLALESNRSLLGGLLGQAEISPESLQKEINHLKSLKTTDYSPDRCINVFHCLLEMNDNSILQEIQQYLRSGNRPKTELTDTQCSALAFVLIMAEQVVDDFDPESYNASWMGKLRLMPAVKNSIKARLVEQDLKLMHCEIVAAALGSSPSHLRDIDLSYNYLDVSDMELICAGLKSPNCKLEILRLAHCWLSKRSCELLAEAINSSPSHLKMLDLSFNILPQSSVTLLRSTGNKELSVKHGGEHWIDPSTLRRYFHIPKLDPNTANKGLALSDDNKTVTQVGREQPYPDHLDRFDTLPQIMCTEGLTGRRYWEVEVDGDSDVAVTYRGINRRGQGKGTWLGLNGKSWTLFLCKQRFLIRYNKKEVVLPVYRSGSNRVGVYADGPGGTLSFYSITFSDTLIHLYTFQSTFTVPLYPAFGVYTGSVTIHKAPYVPTQPLS